jgi:V/A-type H+-transporting ATPase subunit K
MFYAIIFALTILIAVPVLLARNGKIKNSRSFIVGNVSVFFLMTVLLSTLVFGTSVFAETTTAASAASNGLANGLGYLAAALTTGLACVGAGIAVAAGSSAAIGATSEDPKMLSKGLIFVALGEGIVLYGLLISFQILNKLG